MTVLEIKNYKFAPIPSSWEELTFEDFIFLGELYPFTDTTEFHVTCLAHFCKVYTNRKSRLVLKSLSPEEIYDIITIGNTGHLFKFLFEFPSRSKPAKQTLIARHGMFWKSFIGPMTDLDDMRMGEFRDIEKCASIYLANKNETSLNLLVSILYRPKMKGTELRELYDRLSLDMRCKIISTVSLKKRLALMLQYIAMRGHVIESHSNIFKKDASSTGTSDWSEIIDLTAKSIVDKSTVENVFLWDFLSYLATQSKHTEHAQL